MSPERRRRIVPSRPTRTRRVWPIVLACVLVVVLIGAGVLVAARYVVGTAKNSELVLDTELHEVERTDQQSTPRDGAVDFLLVGTDSRVDMQGNALSPEDAARLRVGSVDTTNTDAVLLLRLQPATGSARVISIPRDTYINDRRFGNTKINAVYGMHQAQASGDHMAQADAGRKALTEAVASLTGATIDHYVEVGLMGFVLFTDAVGGVDVCLHQATSDEMTGASFQAGPQTLDGVQALSFVRQRHGLARGDLDRVVRQQAYLSGMVHKVLSTGTLTSPQRLHDLLKAVERSVAVDQGVVVDDLVKVAGTLDPSKVVFETIPVEDIAGVGDHGESVVTVDIPTVQRFVHMPLPTDTGEPAPAPGFAEDIQRAQAQRAARVYVTSGDIGLAESTATKLRDAGLVVTDVALAPAQLQSAQAQVLAAQTDPQSQRIAEVTGLPLNVDPTLPTGTTVVLVGSVPAASYTPPTFQAGPAPDAPQGSGGAGAADHIPCVN